MAEIVPAQRWGVPAGAAAGVTEDNPAMPDGVATVQGVAAVVNRALAPG